MTAPVIQPGQATEQWTATLSYLGWCSWGTLSEEILGQGLHERIWGPNIGQKLSYDICDRN